MSETTQTKESLAKEIATSFKEEGKQRLYESIFQEHKLAHITKAFDEVKKVPQSKIRKSKSALFFYLLRKYAEKED